MEGQATAGHVLVVLGIAVDARVEAPALLTAVGIDSDGNAVRRADEQIVANLQRRHLIGDLAGVTLAGKVTGVELPGLFQLADVVRRDQIGRRVTIAAVGAAVGFPFAGNPAGLPVGVQALHLRIAEFAGDRVVILGQRVGDPDPRDQRAGQQPQAEQPTGAITPDQPIAHVTIDERQDQPEPEDAPEVDARR